jgi:hypothetical protein
MKRWSLPFSRFKGCNFLNAQNQIKKHLSDMFVGRSNFFINASLSIAIALATVQFFASCQSRKPQENDAPSTFAEVSAKTPDINQSLAEKSSSLSSVTEAPAKSWLPVKASAMSPMPFVWISAESCLGDELHLKFNLLTSSLRTEFVWSQKWSSLDFKLNIEGRILTGHADKSFEDVKSNLCQLIQDSSVSTVLTADLFGQFERNLTSNLKAVVPDCDNLSLTDLGPSCQMQGQMPQSAIVTLEDYQLNMTRRWSRQPYILARKVGASLSLARAVSRLASDDSLDKFCKLMEVNYSEELPLIMASKRWREAVCLGSATERRAAAQYGLQKSIDELTTLRLLYEATSKPATLNVRIPEHELPISKLPGQTVSFRVVFTPDRDVTSQLVQLAGLTLGTKESIAQLSRGHHQRKRTASRINQLVNEAPKNENVTVCWHPFFSESSELHGIANGMHLAGETKKLTCGDDHLSPVGIKAADYSDQSQLTITGAQALAKYLMQTLSSETEFVIDNGRSKLIRLPEGKYEYVIQVLPPNPIDAEDEVSESSVETKGTINWGTGGSHAIKNW